MTKFCLYIKIKVGEYVGNLDGYIDNKINSKMEVLTICNWWENLGIRDGVLMNEMFESSEWKTTYVSKQPIKIAN